MEKMEKLQALHMVNQMFVDSWNALSMLHDRLDEKGGVDVNEFTTAENELSESYEWILNEMGISRDDETYREFIIKVYKHNK